MDFIVWFGKDGGDGWDDDGWEMMTKFVDTPWKKNLDKRRKNIWELGKGGKRNECGRLVTIARCLGRLLSGFRRNGKNDFSTIVSRDVFLVIVTCVHAYRLRKQLDCPNNNVGCLPSGTYDIHTMSSKENDPMYGVSNILHSSRVCACG